MLFWRAVSITQQAISLRLAMRNFVNILGLELLNCVMTIASKYSAEGPCGDTQCRSAACKADLKTLMKDIQILVSRFSHNFDVAVPSSWRSTPHVLQASAAPWQ